jgi:hypothetical protein
LLLSRTSLPAQSYDYPAAGLINNITSLNVAIDAALNTTQVSPDPLLCGSLILPSATAGGSLLVYAKPHVTFACGNALPSMHSYS